MKQYSLTILAVSLLSLGSIAYAQQPSNSPSTNAQPTEPKTVPVLGKVQIDSMTASGENQTTIIDEAGNLKIVEENKAKPAETTSTTTATTTTSPSTKTTSPGMSNVPSTPTTTPPTVQPNGTQPAMPAPATMPMPAQSPLPTPAPAAPIQPANPAQGSLGTH